MGVVDRNILEAMDMHLGNIYAMLNCRRWALRFSGDLVLRWVYQAGLTVLRGVGRCDREKWLPGIETGCRWRQVKKEFGVVQRSLEGSENESK